MHFVKINELRKFLAPHYGKSWGQKIKILWLEGMAKNPVPTLSVAAMPIILIHGTLEYYFHNTDRIKKYMQNPPIYRPGDPRIANIQHYSGLD